MTFIQKINGFLKNKIIFLSLINTKAFRIQKFNPVILITFLIIFSILFFVTSNLINKKNEENVNNFKEIGRTNEFSNFKNFLFSKINSPYEEINYVIKNNDTVEKILKKFKVRNEDIKSVSIELKQKKTCQYTLGEKTITYYKEIRRWI